MWLPRVATSCSSPSEGMLLEQYEESRNKPSRELTHQQLAQLIVDTWVAGDRDRVPGRNDFAVRKKYGSGAEVRQLGH